MKLKGSQTTIARRRVHKHLVLPRLSLDVEINLQSAHAPVLYLKNQIAAQNPDQFHASFISLRFVVISGYCWRYKSGVGRLPEKTRQGLDSAIRAPGRFTRCRLSGLVFRVDEDIA